ncbi:MAG: hypothetical protein ACRDZ4_13350 [Egibacteraceae bacterium]
MPHEPAQSGRGTPEGGGPGPTDASGHRSRWEQRAGFTVFFDVCTEEGPRALWQTRLYHDETDEETSLEGIEPTGWAAWILDRVRASGETATASPQSALGPERGEPDATPASPSACRLTVEIVDVRVVRKTPSATAAAGEEVRVAIGLKVLGLTRLERMLGAAVIDAILGSPGRGDAASDLDRP